MSASNRGQGNMTPRKRPSVKDRRRGQPGRHPQGQVRKNHEARPEQAQQGTARWSGQQRATRGARQHQQPRQRTTRQAGLQPQYSPKQFASQRNPVASALSGLPPLALAGAAVVAAVVLIAVLVFALRGCGGQPPAEEPEQADQGAQPAFQRHEGPYSINVSTTGDIMFGREVSTYVDLYGGGSALANVAGDLAAADITIANLECPLTDDESEALVGKDVLWRSNPAGIDSLKDSGITIASLANNHIMDYGATGLADTLDALDGAGILHAGAGLTEDAAGEPVELEVDGVSVAFFSWTDIIPDNFLAFGDAAGVVSARMNMDDACKRVREAKETHDLVIVAMHWGVEYEDYIDEALQKSPGHALVDAGADVIWGNHPHVIEGIEFYDGALISYSQGDFVCDHYSEKTGESFILNFDLTHEGIENVTATPVYLDDTYGIPSIVTGERAATILDRLELISEGMNTTFTRENDVAKITAAS